MSRACLFVGVVFRFWLPAALRGRRVLSGNVPLAKPLIPIAVLSGFLAIAPLRAGEVIRRLDMGSPQVPAAEGFLRVTDGTQYTPEQGYGWIGTDQHRESFHRTAISPSVVWRPTAAAQLVGGVASSEDLIFQVDLPNGRYAVEVQLGDLGGYLPAGMGRFLDTGVRGEASGGPGGPLFSMAVDANGRRVAADVASRTLPHRGISSITPVLEELNLTGGPVRICLGNHAVIRFEEEITDGRLRLTFSGDETTYRSVLERLKGLADDRLRTQSMYAAGGPFTKSSVLAVIVRPAFASPLVEEQGRLKVVSSSQSPTGTSLLERFARAFNARELEKAASIIETMPRQTFVDARARVLAGMWLAGHPDQWAEREQLTPILVELDRVPAASASERAEIDALRGQVLDFQAGVRDFDQRTKEGQEVVTAMNRAEPHFARACPGEAFYWKSQLYRARIWYSMDPNRNAQLWRQSEALIRQLESVHPNNRWVRYYLHRDPSGWPVADDRSRTASAPQWASEVHNFYNRIIDLGEWWMANRQNPDNGAIGGEWGDDVEIMPLFAYTAVICPDASPKLIEGTMKFADGAWNKSGIIDVHNGFFHLTSDAEHAAEFTGNILGMMLQAKPGDPEYVERCLKTAKMTRDLWMGRNAQGRRLMRSSFLGAFSVGQEADEIDTAICGRALNPAWNVWELNRNPEIARLAVEYADTLLALALSTAKNKPRGILPGAIVYETGELGAAGSPEWWSAPPGPFQGMFSFPQYHGFRSQVLMLAWRITGDEKYLEPLKLEAAFVQQHAPSDRESRDRDERLRLAKATPESVAESRRHEEEYRRGSAAGSDAWIARLLKPMGVVESWENLQAGRRDDSPETMGVTLSRDEVARQARDLTEIARHRWPVMTDDATMTDRVGFQNCYASSIWYSGTRIVAQQFQPSISYEGAGRDFAALVLRHNPRFAKLLYYGFHDAPRDVTVRFWELEPHGVYELVGGPDRNEDDRPDHETIRQSFSLTEPGGGPTLRLTPRETMVFEVRQVSRPNAQMAMTDPAIAPRDIRFDPRGYLLVDVHNIGNAAADDVEVRFYESSQGRTGKLLGRTIVSHIEPPNTLEPQIVRTGIEWTPAAGGSEVTVVLDEENRVTELFERNNRAMAVIKPFDQ